MKQNSEIIIYQTADKAKSTINEHIKNIYAEEDLEDSLTPKHSVQQRPYKIACRRRNTGKFAYPDL